MAFDGFRRGTIGGRIKMSVRIFLELTKFRIAALSTLSAATGYVAFCRTFQWRILTACLGVLVLALGACALNQWQDRKLDALMDRTRGRPLPSGRITPRSALGVAAALLLGGLAVLWLAHGPAPALFGASAVAWYNGFYTYMKRVSAFASVPGSIVGALPPLIGWTAAGGEPLDGHVLALSFFFFLWQVPHFWLLLFLCGPDYEKAGFPALTAILRGEQLARLTFLWTVATAFSALLLRVYGLIASPYVALALVLAGLWLAWSALRLLREDVERPVFARAFRSINLYALLVMGALVLDTAL
jgi:protoheme IX farnesyltransferase